MTLRLLADDLTGALDCAAAFGSGVPVYLDQPPTAQDDSPISAVATATRDINPRKLPQALAKCLPWLCEAGLAFKKVDSLLRGNTLEEVRWLASQGGYTRVVMAPAFPAQGRFMLHEHLAVAPAGVPPTAQHIRGDNVRANLQTSAWPAACELVLPTVLHDADLDRLCAKARWSGQRTLWCGSAGLAAALVRQHAVAHGAAAHAIAPASPNLWVVGASHQDITQRQWVRAMEDYPQALRVHKGNEQALHVVAGALGAGAANMALINLSPAAPLNPAQAAALLQSQAALLTQGATFPARLLVIGGDTVRALATATGVQHMVSGTPVRDGWGRAQWSGGRWNGVWMDCRSGAFGNENDLSAAIAATLC